MNFIPVVMSGGSGTRLWPVSRTSLPKQFCELLDESLMSLTMKRIQRYNPALIVTGQKLKTLTEREIAKNKFNVRSILYETEGKNTAPAIALACRYLEMTGEAKSVCGVFSSDALITNEQAFFNAIEVAVAEANLGKIVVLGIKPDRVETGFGYIQIQNAKLNQAAQVLKFHEKPNYATAEKFVQDGNYFWNAGIFIFQVELMVEKFKSLAPELWSAISTLKSDLSNIKEIYSKVQNISIDYAIIEKLNPALLSCVPCHIGWSDLGSWDVLEQINSNEKLAICRSALQVESKENTVFSNEDKIYGFVGIDDLIVVDTPDALVVCKKGESQKVKNLVELVKKKEPQKLDEHGFDIRPWGMYEVMKDAANFKTKILRIEPGQKTSYQSHAHRSEHWIIVRGTATVLLDEKQHVLKAGEHILIPQGAKHRLGNDSTEVLELVEVQLGSYFGEDDIVRYQDVYGREK